MILKRPSFRRGGNSGIAMLRQRYQRGSDQSFLNPGAPKTIQDFYKDRAEKRQETSKGIEEFLKVKPRQPGTYRGYEVPKQPSPVVNENVDVNVDMRGDPAQFTGGVDLVTDFEALEREAPKPKVETVESSITLDPKAEIEKEAEFIKDLIKNENLTRGENALILAKAIGTPGSISEKISKAADLALPVIKKRDKQDKAVTLKAYELFKKKEAEAIKAGKPTPEMRNIESIAKARKAQGDTRTLEEIKNEIIIEQSGPDKDSIKILTSASAEIIGLQSDIDKQRGKLAEENAKTKPNQKNLDKINKKIAQLQRELNKFATMGGFERLFPGVKKAYLAEGGRIGYAEGTTEEEIKMTETVVDTPGAPTPERQVLKLSYSELRNKLPKEISDDIVELLANSTEALQDFAYITTQDDVSNFNVKYGVNLVIPQNA
jgi:hypothetical protein|tara:strand:+ start:555 stop:1850 length:1296 start_codon:yes stop_codon:yes gene_type:complete